MSRKQEGVSWHQNNIPCGAADRMRTVTLQKRGRGIHPPAAIQDPKAHEAEEGYKCPM